MSFTSSVFLLLALQTAGPAAMAQSESTPLSAEQIVQRQLDAYNTHDLDAFVATYADNIEIFRHPGEPMLKGQAALRASYGPLFAQAKPAARVTNRTVMGDQIVDVEAITVGGTEHCCAVAVYKVANGRIVRVDFIAAPDFMRPTAE